MARKKPAGRVIVIEVLQHWSGFLPAYVPNVCEVPEDIKEFNTPEEAWKNADSSHIADLLERVNVNFPVEDGEELYEAADNFRKKNGIPKKVQRLIDRWLNQKGGDVVETVNDENGNELPFTVRR
jgi:hypothetical protein